MKDIQIKRYKQPKAGWIGWIEPKNKDWIMFVHEDGGLHLFDNRDENGGVLDNGFVTNIG